MKRYKSKKKNSKRSHSKFYKKQTFKNTNKFIKSKPSFKNTVKEIVNPYQPKALRKKGLYEKLIDIIKSIFKRNGKEVRQ